MIDLFKVFCPDGLGEYLEEIFRSGIITEGDYSDKFEKLFSQFIDNPNCSLTNSCTSALTLAYHLCGLTEDDEVIVTPLTCTATIQPIMSFKANIVWADIDPQTGNIDPESVLSSITSKTKAIAAVHWAGQPFDLDSIKSIASEHGLKVIEDCAHSLGAKYNGHIIGSHSDFACFSFQAIKHLTTADGGAIAVANKYDDARIKKLRWFGVNRKYHGNKWEQDIIECGYKFHMNNVNAAIGIKQMQYIDDIISRHKDNGRYYNNHIDNPLIRKIVQNPKSESSYWIYSLLVRDKVKFQKHMAEYGISTDVVHIRNDTYSAFKRFKKKELKGVDKFCSEMINIPVGWWVNDHDREKVVRVVNRFKL